MCEVGDRSDWGTDDREGDCGDQCCGVTGNEAIFSGNAASGSGTGDNAYACSNGCACECGTTAVVDFDPADVGALKVLGFVVFAESACKGILGGGRKVAGEVLRIGLEIDAGANFQGLDGGPPRRVRRLLSGSASDCSQEDGKQRSFFIRQSVSNESRSGNN